MRIAIDLNDVYRDFTYKFKEVYTENVDSTFEVEDEDITTIRFDEVFPFETKEEYIDFRYCNYSYEIYGRANVIGAQTRFRLNNWINKDIENLDCEEVPEVMIVSPYEYGQTIQATLAFLAANPVQAREYYFPKNSIDIWDRCDILITANPELIEACPEGKLVCKIESSYNQEVECEYTYATLLNVLEDEKFMEILNRGTLENNE